MESTNHSLGSLWTAIREEHRAVRAARSERKYLERELASYTSPSDLNDLDAILDRHSEDETADIRRILTGRRSA
jgi:hypothetical protein